MIYAGALSVYSARILSNKPLVILGEASDAIYILHGPILFWERWFLVKVVGWEWLPNWNVASSVVIVTIASVLVYYLFERPVRRRIAHYLLAARMSSSG